MERGVNINESFCSECGSPRKDTEQFCANCGHDAGSLQPEMSAQPKMPKRKKVMLGALAVLLIALFSAHFYIKSMISPDAQITGIYEALHKGDAKQLIEAIDIADDVIYDPQVYMDSLQYEDPSFLMEEITAAVERTEAMGLPQIITSDYIGDFLKVEQKKYLGLYKRIHITALDYEARLETDLPSGKIAIGENEWIFEGKPISLGRLLPGEYVAVLSNEDLEDSLESNILVQSNYRENVYTFDKDDYMISFVGEGADGLLVINGEKTGEYVSESLEVGPFFTQELIELSLIQENDGQSQHSDIVQAYPGDNVTFPIALQPVEPEEQEEISEENDRKEEQQKVFSEKKDKGEIKMTAEEKGEEIRRAAEKFVSSFRSAYEEALNTRNFSLIVPYLQEGSVAYEEFEEFIGDMEGSSYRYDFIKNDMTGTVINAGNLVAVDTYEEFNFTNHSGKVTHYKREKRYDLFMNGTEEFEIYNIKISDTIRENTGG